MVYIIFPLTNELRKSSKRLSVKYLSPVVIYEIIDPNSFLLCTLDSELFLGLSEHERLKPAIIRTSEGNVNPLPQLKQMLHAGIRFA